MNARQLPSILRRHRSLRWAVPAGVAGVAVVIASGVFSSSAASHTLPRTTPAALLAQVGAQPVTGFSGTVVTHVSLGLPDLPTIAGVSSSSPLASLLSGSRTLQVWYGGADEQRIALLGSTDETDLFRSGRTVWRWDSSDREADRVLLAKRRTNVPDPATSAVAGLTPGGMTALALGTLKSLEPTTQVTVRPGGQVADRSTYALILRPRRDTTRIGAVHIEVDGQTKVPLGVQIFPRGSSSPAIDVAYTSISFADPPATDFQFTPPVGARVRTISLARLRDHDDFNPARLSLSGADWSSVLSYATHRTLGRTGLGLNGALTPVSGTWGRGRLLETSLLCVLVTHDGRVFAGAVDPSDLFAAAARR